MTKTPPKTTPTAMLVDDRLSHADSKVLVYWLRREKEIPTFVFPLDRFYKMGPEEIVREIKRTAGVDITLSEIESAIAS